MLAALAEGLDSTPDGARVLGWKSELITVMSVIVVIERSTTSYNSVITDCS